MWSLMPTGLSTLHEPWNFVQSIAKDVQARLTVWLDSAPPNTPLKVLTYSAVSLLCRLLLFLLLLRFIVLGALRHGCPILRSLIPSIPPTLGYPGSHYSFDALPPARPPYRLPNYLPHLRLQAVRVLRYPLVELPAFSPLDPLLIIIASSL